MDYGRDEKLGVARAIYDELPASFRSAHTFEEFTGYFGRGVGPLVRKGYTGFSWLNTVDMKTLINFETLKSDEAGRLEGFARRLPDPLDSCI